MFVLAPVESSLEEHDPTPLSQILLHHGHIESGTKYR